MGYRIRLVQEFFRNGQESWFAGHPELLGCHAMGRTCKEASEELFRVRETWLQLARRHGATIPPEPDDLWVDLVFAPTDEKEVAA